MTTTTATDLGQTMSFLPRKLGIIRAPRFGSSDRKPAQQGYSEIAHRS
jgi:hypothetical protein